ncbi:MAG: hypothetical protein J5956_10055 [Ruminococcus sp.]|nr:hypothetical protein [Ruminococcus sp.]
MNKQIEQYKNYVHFLDNWGDYHDVNGKDLYDNMLDFYIKYYDTDFPHDFYVYIERDDNDVLSFRTALFENVGGNSWLNDDHFTLFSVGGTEHNTIMDEIEDFVECFRQNNPDMNVPAVDEYGDKMSEYEQAEYIRLSYPEQFHTLEDELLRESDNVKDYLYGIIENKADEAKNKLKEIEYYNEYYDENDENQNRGRF